jgi:hypothetical protein
LGRYTVMRWRLLSCPQLGTPGERVVMSFGCIVMTFEKNAGIIQILLQNFE